ncbi:MAG: sodium:solute symporter family transporter [Lysobacter sp.]
MVVLLTLWIARDPDSRMPALIRRAWHGFGAAFGPVLLSLFRQRMTRNGARATTLPGAFKMVVLMQVAVGSYGSSRYEINQGVLVATVATVGGSLGR